MSDLVKYRHSFCRNLALNIKTIIVQYISYNIFRHVIPTILNYTCLGTVIRNL
jgi:hypothetical protein